MSGKSYMAKFMIRNIVQMVVNCSYICVFYMMLLSLLDTAGVGANKLPEEDVSMVTEVNNADIGSSDLPAEKSGGFFNSEVGFVHAFVASFSVIIVAMRHPRLTVFTGAIAALALMTVLSAVFGMAATIIPRVYTYYISTALFALFGLKMLRDGYYMSATEAAEELEEVQSDIRKREDELERETTASVVQDAETGVIRKNKQRSAWNLLFRIFMQAFTMTFLAEWGDRSQLTTIILSARENVYGVIIGGVIGHAICTGLAVIGGRMIAQKISVRTVTLIGGVVFLIFAVSALFFSPEEEPVNVSP